MSRTYKCTHGASKKLIPYFDHTIADSCYDIYEYNADINYIDGTADNKSYADGLRSGYRHHAPRWYRKHRHNRHMNKHMQRVRNAIKYDEYDDLICLVLKKDADYDYF